MLVSSCSCCVLEPRGDTQPALYFVRFIVYLCLCQIYSLFVFVSDILDDQIVLPYFSVVLGMAVYELSKVSLDFPPCVVMGAFIIFVVFFALSVVFCMCSVKVRLGLNDRPSILRSLFVRSVVLFIVSFIFVDFLEDRIASVRLGSIYTNSFTYRSYTRGLSLTHVIQLLHTRYFTTN